MRRKFVDKIFGGCWLLFWHDRGGGGSGIIELIFIGFVDFKMCE